MYPISINLPNKPADLPRTTDIRDFEIAEGKFARVILELDVGLRDGHFVMKAQAYEMNADGTFVMAPNGYPSRSNSTDHVVNASALGDTVLLADAWCRFTGICRPDEEGLSVVDAKPDEPGQHYGAKVWDSARQHAWVWTEGLATSTARAKLQDLENVLATSNVRSGIAFR